MDEDIKLQKEIAAVSDVWRMLGADKPSSVYDFDKGELTLQFMWKMSLKNRRRVANDIICGTGYWKFAGGFIGTNESCLFVYTLKVERDR